MLYPEEFLQALDKQRNKITYARIISLTFDERPLETIEGRVTSGSLSLDGASAIRRTCQLSMVSAATKLTDYYWSLNTKIKLSVGIENHIDTSYPDIIWFEQGIFVITSFNASFSSNSYTINLSGKDKMCLLNGEIGGTLNSSVDFGAVDQEIEPGVWKTIKLPIKNIIREMVHAYAGEPFHNIIINDLETVGLILQEYRYDKPMFLFRKPSSNEYTQGFIDQTIEVQWNEQNPTLGELLDNDKFIFESLQNDFVEGPAPSIVKWNNTEYVIAKIDYGETAGYTETELTYPGELIANVGESITSVLDKIKNFLGEFEYFYNLQGQFIFQKKKTYAQSAWSPIQTDENGTSYVEDLQSVNSYAYKFMGGEFFTAINNTPNLANLRNDFSVWGTRGSSNLSIHMRYALDRKPVEYTTIAVSDEDLKPYNAKYDMSLKGQVSEIYRTADTYRVEEATDNSPKIIYCDWRELIYRMALDYNKYNHLDDFEYRVAAANPVHFSTGQTGYQQYYTDLLGFWRQLYNPFGDKISTFPRDDSRFGWARAVYETPEQLLFWFDFMDAQGELEQFSIPALGARPKVKNDTAVKAIYYRDTPNVIFQSGTMSNSGKTGYRYFNVPAALSMFSTSAQGKSAKEEIDTLLYNHSYCIESVSITSIPIYYLDTNIRIYISDINSGIEGEYIVSKISLPLSYNGTMNITATKAAQRLL